jgi:hypothetical protein
LGRQPDLGRMGWEGVMALVSQGEEANQFGRLSRLPEERARLHREEHRLVWQTLREIARQHLPPVPTPIQAKRATNRESETELERVA